MANSIGKYIGLYKVKSEKTLENGNFLVEYEEVLNDNNVNISPDPEEYPPHVLENIVTDEATDMMYVREKKITPIIEEILAILLRHNVYIGGENMGEVKDILTGITRSIRFSREKADDLLWGTVEDYKTLGQCHDIIKTNVPKKEKE